MSKLKLLTKREIDVAKSKDRNREVSEGKKLAESVDRLREIQLQEKASLDKFRINTIAVIHEEIIEQTKRRDDLFDEVRHLEWRKELAQKPLDEEIANLTEERRVINAEYLKIEYDRDAIRLEQVKIANDREIIEKERKHIDLERAISSRFLSEASQKDEESERLLREARRISDEAVFLRKEVSNNLGKEMERLAVREQNVKLKEDSFVKRDQKLDIRELRLKDREETLARNIKRYVKP